MALIDRFLPMLGFAALLHADSGLTDAAYEDVRGDMENLIRQALEGDLPSSPLAAGGGCSALAGDSVAFSGEAFFKSATAGGPRSVPDNALHDALFASCAFADEMLLTSAWSGRGRWAREPLQQTFFRSSDAGEAFFRRLEALSARLIRERQEGLCVDSACSGETPAESDAAGEDMTRQVVEVYAACLALGYTGRYYRPEERETLGGLIRSGRDAVLEGSVRRERLFPEVYAEPPHAKTPVLGYLGRMVVLWGTPALATLLCCGLYNLLLSERLAAVEALFR